MKWEMNFCIMFIICILVGSCQNNSISNPIYNYKGVLYNPAIIELEIKNIGNIHNEALSLFHERHNLLGENKISQIEFIKYAVESINEAVNNNGINILAQDQDVVVILSLFKKLRDEGVYDFFSVNDTIPLEYIFNYFENNGILDSTTCHKYMQVIEEISGNNANKLLIGNSFENSLYLETNNTDMDYLFIEILGNSHNYWNNLIKCSYEENENSCFTMFSRTLQSELEAYDIREKGKDISDVLGGILGAYCFKSTYATILCAYCASIAFTTVYDNPDWFQFGDYNYYHTR